MRNILKIAILTAIIASVIFPSPIFAATKAKFYYAGWLPYWKKAGGTMETALNLDKLNEISPFSYEVNPDGTIVDKLKINTEQFWQTWFLAARDLKIKIIPTIAWFNDNAIHDVLSEKEFRAAHINEIMKIARLPNFGGIEIDYENKFAETNKYFSQFLKELSAKLHKEKMVLACTVEPRTPPASRFKEIPKILEYANDYKTLNKYCDQVRIMAYDQGRIDLLLNKSKGNGKLYAPVADPDWVKKVIKETTKTISAKKIMLGIPTYGYEYEIIQNGNGITYKRIRSRTYEQAIDLAKTVGATPTRNSAGELSFTYIATSSPFNDNLNTTSTPDNSNYTRLVWFSDAKAIEDKIKLAKTYGLRGVVLFKLDGEFDSEMWKKFK